MHVIESFYASKTGLQEDSEDLIVCTDHFACVVDGASSQCKREWNGMNGGKLAALKVCEAVKLLDPEVQAREAVNAMTEALASVYRQYQLVDEMRDSPIERCAASFALYSERKGQLWFVGDCQALVVLSDGTSQAFLNPKLVDQVCAAACAMFLESELALGKMVSELQSEQPGRAFVQALIDRQFIFQNTSRRSDYAYSVIDGFPVADAGIKIVEVLPSARHIVLASDGYPKLFSTLSETEAYRVEILRKDPLLIGDEKRVGALRPGNDSYDDRSYLRVAFHDNT